MATVLYLRALNVPATVVSSNPLGFLTAARAITPGAATLIVQNPLSLLTTVGTGAGTAATTTSVAGTTAGILAQRGVFISAPLAAGVTISGTISFALCGLESAMTANAGFKCAVYRLDNTGAATLVVNSAFGTELGLSLSRNGWTATPTSTVFSKGDRILIVPMFVDAGGTMGSGQTLTFQYDGATASTADSNVSFTEALTFGADAAGTTYYLRDTASSIPNAFALSQASGPGVVSAVHTTVAGPTTYPSSQWTATAGGTAIEWYTPALNAFTLAGTISSYTVSTVDAPSASPFDFAFIEIAVCNADGSGAVVFAGSYSSPTGASVYLSGADISVAQGQVIRYRIYQAEGSSNSVAGTNRTLYYNDSGTFQTRIRFTQTITEAPTVATGAAPRILSVIQAVNRAAIN